jgi:hypothetical protein
MAHVWNSSGICKLVRHSRICAFNADSSIEYGATIWMTARMAEWMASDLSQLDLLVIQIDGLHVGIGGPSAAPHNFAVTQTKLDS